MIFIFPVLFVFAAYIVWGWLTNTHEATDVIVAVVNHPDQIPFILGSFAGVAFVAVPILYLLTAYLMRSGRTKP